MEQRWVPGGTAAGRGRLGEASSPWEQLRSRRPWLPRRIWDRSPAAGDEQRRGRGREGRQGPAPPSSRCPPCLRLRRRRTACAQREEQAALQPARRAAKPREREREKGEAGGEGARTGATARAEARGLGERDGGGDVGCWRGTVLGLRPIYCIEPNF